MSILSLLLLPALASAHFNLNAPAAAGTFDEDTEGNGPCGGITVDFAKDTVSDFHVGGEPVAMLLGHPQANWLFRGTLDETAGGNWTQLFPITQQVGLGDFCEPSITAPESWVGSKGVLGVVADAPDGLLYQVCSTTSNSVSEGACADILPLSQCAAVNFVSGTGTATSDCKNGSVTASFVADSTLTALLSDNSTSSSNSSSTSSSTGTSSSSTSSSKSSGSAAAGLVVPSTSGLVGSLMTVVAFGLLGAGFVL